ERGTALRTRACEGCQLVWFWLVHDLAHSAAHQHLGAERLWPTTGELAKLPRHESNDGIRDVVVARVLLEVIRVSVHGYEGQREITDHLGRWGHLGRAPQDATGRRIRVFDPFEVVAQAQCDCLLPQVAELSAG